MQPTSNDGTVMAIWSGYLGQVPDGQTYQLWALMPEGMRPTMVSVGVLGRNPSASAFTTDTKVMGYGLTMEDSPGVMVTDQPMMFEGRLT
jgi:hypothetical protein